MTRRVSHEQLKRVIYTSYERKVPLFIHGRTGIGKSESVKNVAKEIADANKLKFLEGDSNGKDTFGFIDIRISQLDPSDLRGLPSMQGEVTKWLPPSWLPRGKDGYGILFFDELNLAPPSIQASAYQLILDRRLGDYKLPAGWLIVSAGNTAEDRANIFELPAPLSNRFIHVELNVPTKEEWTSWAIPAGIDSSIVAFLEFKPSFLFKFDAKSKEKSFPTPRAWSYVNRLIKDNKADKDEIEILVASAVGEGVAIEYSAFLELKKKINLNEILDNPKSVREIREISLRYSLLSALVERYREKKENLQKILKVAEYLEAEFAILLLRFMKNTRADFVKDVVKLKEWVTLAQKYSKYLIDLRGE